MSSLNIRTKNDDSLYQIYEKPTKDGDLISKSCRDAFVKMGWVSQCEGYNIITSVGCKAVQALGIYEAFTERKDS